MLLERCADVVRTFVVPGEPSRDRNHSHRSNTYNPFCGRNATLDTCLTIKEDPPQVGADWADWDGAGDRDCCCCDIRWSRIRRK